MHRSFHDWRMKRFDGGFDPRQLSCPDIPQFRTVTQVMISAEEATSEVKPKERDPSRALRLN
jgi:hypothetical protein